MDGNNTLKPTKRSLGKDNTQDATTAGVKRRKSQHTSIATNATENGTVAAIKRPFTISNGAARKISEYSDDDNESIETAAIEFDPVQVSAENAHQWQGTINKVIKSVVAIRFAQVEAFDTDNAIISEATGFVVDSQRGIILTNRHVVCSGPFVGYAVFDNHEETTVKPIYRDPVHDFGFLKFDPSTIKYMKITELKLRPDLAKVGCEIRVVGNDAGEKLSILSGFISRLDRNAPEYGTHSYNDFNTEYIQAAASASGGSSGSPVIDIGGNTLALQAGGSTESATDYFLPVYRVLRALQLVQANKPVTRGTIQTQWLLKPFDECRRLGLSEEAEEKARKRFPKSVSMLVADVILPEGPGDSKIKEGDILISINGKFIYTFIQVDDILDSSVNETVHILLQRSGKDIEVDCKVQDLHSITPSRYVEICGSTFNDLSYQMARIYVIPVSGVFVSSASGPFSSIGSGWMIEAIDNKPTPNLDAFIKVMQGIPDCKDVTVSCKLLGYMHTTRMVNVQIDRHWRSARIAVRNDESGLWDFTDLGKPLTPEPLKPLSAAFLDVPMEQPQCSKLVRSIVYVSSSNPIRIDSFPYEDAGGYGVVMDAAKGYVIVSRKYVPTDLGDIRVTVADSIKVPAKVIFLHPMHNYAIVKYDPSLVLAPVETPKFSNKRITRGESLNFIGYSSERRIMAAKTKVTNILSLNVPYNFYSPRYRGFNLEIFYIDNTSCSESVSGIFADDDGTIRGLWMDYMGEVSADGAENFYNMGFDINHFNPVIESFKSQSLLKDNASNDDKISVPTVKIIDAEFNSMNLLHARQRGVAENWITAMEKKQNTNSFEFLYVTHVSCPDLSENQTASTLKDGDIILTINDKLISSVAELEVPLNFPDDATLEFKIVRKAQEQTIKVKPVAVKDTDKLTVWSGAQIQAPHHGVRQVIKKLPSRVYVVGVGRGSPAMQYGISATNFITHVNEVETPDLETFVNEVKKVPDNTYVKLRVVTFDEVPFAISLKTNYHYFPTTDLRKNVGGGGYEGGDKEREGKWKAISYDKENKVIEEKVATATN